MKTTPFGIESLGSTTTTYPELMKTPKRLLPPPQLHQRKSFLAQTTFLRLGFKISNTLRRKLCLGLRILKVGSIEKIFHRNFSVIGGENLLKASQCYLSTTAGPIDGLLFISTDKLAFCSDRTIKLSSSIGDSIGFHYKVVLPLRKIKRANQSENIKKPSQKYLNLVNKDDFEFWLMGFRDYKRTFQCLYEAISQASY